jgi:hypothetical protein
LSEIPEEIRKQILNAPEKAFGDVQSKADIGNAFIQREQSRVNASLALDSIVSNADKANTGIGILVRQVQKDLGGKESVLRVDKEQLNKSISSFVNNYDFDKLDEISKGKGTKALDAGIAKNALSKGNFQEFLKFNGGLGIIPENILKDSLKIIKDISKADLYEATSSAVKSFNELSEAAKEKANQIARVKTSFEDFTNFERSFNKKNALSSIISSSNASLTSARFGIVADQSDTPDSIKQAISYGREISNLNQRESTVKNSASTDLMKIVSAVYGDTGRNSLNEAGGKDFMEKFLKGSLDANAIEANLEKVVKASETTVINGKSVEAFSGDQKEVLNTVSNDLKLQLTEIKIEKQIAP